METNERQYIAKLLIESSIGDEESEVRKVTSSDYRKLWEGKVSELQDVPCGRFYTGMDTKNDVAGTKTKEENDDSYNLQKFVAINFKVCRNAYVIRVKKTIQTYLDTERFGMMQFSKLTRKEALYWLTTSGLDRSSDTFKVVKPLFQSMALNREKKGLYEFTQGDNMGKYVKERMPK